MQHPIQIDLNQDDDVKEFRDDVYDWMNKFMEKVSQSTFLQFTIQLFFLIVVDSTGRDDQLINQMKTARVPVSLEVCPLNS